MGETQAEKFVKIHLKSPTATEAKRSQKLMKMRYKVNFHVLLYFLSSCSTMMASQTPNILTQHDRNSNSNDTTQPNTFLINVNKNNNHSTDAATEHTTYLASTNEMIASVLAPNNQLDGRTNRTQFQTSKFIDNKWRSKTKC